MPGSFATGLTEGLLNGFQQQQEKKSQAETAQKSQQIQAALDVIHSVSPESPAYDAAARQLQDLMQGKKPGSKGGGELAMPIQQMLKLIQGVKGHSAQQAPQPEEGATRDAPAGQMVPGGGGMRPKPQSQQSQSPGGWTEQVPTANGPVPAPGTGGMPGQLPNPNNPQTGRPTVSGTGSAAGGIGNEATPQQSPQSAGSPYDVPLAQAKKLLAQYNDQNDYTGKRREAINNRIAQLEDAKLKDDVAAQKFEREEGGKEKLAAMQAQFKSELAAAAAQSKEELARVQGEWKQKFEQQAADAKTALTKQIDDDRKERETLVAQIKAKATPGKSATGTADTSIKTGQGVTSSKDDSTTKASALYGLITNRNPTFGLGKSAQRDAYNKARAEIIDDLGPDGVAKLQASFKAGSGALVNVVKQRATVGAFENTFEADLNNARKAAEDVPRKQSALFNSWQQLAQAKLSDNSPLAKFRVATQTAINQYARLMFSATGGGTSTDTARADAEKLLSTAMAKGSYGSAIDQMQLEVKNRTKGLDLEIQRQLAEIGEGGGQTPKPGTPPAAQAAPAQGATIHFKEGQDSYDIPAAEVDGFKKLHPQAQAVQ